MKGKQLTWDQIEVSDVTFLECVIAFYVFNTLFKSSASVIQKGNIIAGDKRSTQS